MDKYEYKLKLEQLKNLVQEKDYKTAAEIADTINWRKVKSAATLCMVGEIYDRDKQYENSREILLMAYDRATVGRNIIYRLTLVALKMGNLEEAKEYYEEFLEVAPYDNLKYVLRYQIAKIEGASLEDQIKILEEFKEREYIEEWAFELAYLYHRSGNSERCVEVCDELVLWFGDGKYVEKALELKMLYQPLNKYQEEKYRQFKTQKKGVVEVHPTDNLESGEIIRETIQIPDLAANPGRFNTMNLQEELAKNMQQIMEADTRETVSDTMDHIKKMVEEIPYLQVPQEEEEIEEEDRYGHIETDEEIDDSLETSFREMLAEDWDGQIRLSVPGGGWREPQVNGQIRIEDVLEEWEKTRRAAEAAMAVAQQRKLESAKARALQEAEELMERLNEIIPKLDAGVSPQELLAERYLQGEDLRDNYLSEGNTEKGEYLEEEISEEEYLAASRDWEGYPREDFQEMVPSQENLPEDPMEEAPDIDVHEEQRMILENNPEAIEYFQEQQQDWQNDPEGAALEETIDNENSKDTDDLGENTAEELGAEYSEEAETEYSEEAETGYYEEKVKTEYSEEEAETEYYEEVETEYSEKAETEYYEEVETEYYEEAEYAEEELETGYYEEAETEYSKEELEAEYSGEQDWGNDPGTEMEEEDVSEENFGIEGQEIETPLEELLEQEAMQEEEEERKDAERYLESVFRAARASREEKNNISNQKESSAAERTGMGGEAEPEQEIIPEITMDPEEEPITKLNEEQKEIFSYFVPVTGMEQQLCQVLEGALHRKGESNRSVSGNILITGGRGSGKTVLATDLIKAIKRSGRHPSGKVGKITGESLNQKDLSQLLKAVAGGYLIIEHAGEISQETATRLSLLMEQDTDGLLFIMEDTRKGIDKVLSRDPNFAKKFTERIKIPVFTSDELVEFAKAYAEEQECEIDDMGILALYNCISNIQKLDEATTLTEVKEIVDMAISSAERGGLKKLFGGKKFSPEGYLYLREKDFEE
ncbi:MAG: hypothetical protein HFH41_07870 [Lachnospiraceae bacterium]|nr:hypothetical protein [Lachnospiraceae bacterium]